jgi:O-antigen ligase
MPSRLSAALGDRIQVNSLLIVLCCVSVLLLGSQSAASYPSYFLAISMLVTLRQWNDVFHTPFAWIVVALLTYLCLSSFWSEPFDFRKCLGVFGRGLLVFFFVVAVAECQLRGQVQLWLGRSLAIAGMGAAAAALVVYWIDPPHDFRLSGLGQLDNPVVVGLVFGAVLILLGEIMLSDPARGWKITALIGGLAVLFAIYLSGSRNAWMSTSIGLLVLFFSTVIKDRQRFVAALSAVLVVLAAIVGMLLASDQGRELLLPRGDSFRLEIWSSVFADVSSNHPLFGKGILTPDQVPVGDRVFHHPHNMYLAVLFQGGLAGLMLFGLLIAWALVAMLSGFGERSASLALGLISMALVSYVLDGHELIDKVGETWFLFWLPVGIGLGLVWGSAPRDSIVD